MSLVTPTLRRNLGIATATIGLVASLAACGGSSTSTDTGSNTTDGVTKVEIAAVTGAPFTASTIEVPVVESIRSTLPAAARDKGKLVIGLGALPAGFPPLAFVGTDQKTLTGSEPDLGRLVAAVLGLEPEIANSTWENLFVGIDSGRTDVGFSNITDTEKRKEKYDFASYRQDNLAFEVKKDSTWNFNDDYKTLAGKTISVSAGTNQEKILLEWKTKLESEGSGFKVAYFPDANGVNLALSSGKIAAYFGPNPSIAYHVAQGAGGVSPTRTAGQWSGAGETLQGLIAATTKKGNGLAEPIAAAINYLIDNGQYATWLKAYNLSEEAVTKSEFNPPGLPLTNS